ncbi:phenylacetate-CoA oxygenase subunit PaaC [Halorussus gelatinilyticus]|uniref:Phenylacetate-CoA oxygenase subunit PaaC n=1 Tax=Halorussus gelatinilyticus TaxID=2937524 RepID=A0A8U0IGR0_9EURY|nr:1,2-phenylacetyl-CoA epoxidase subunit PaaC [Halorussus gelatinilyticus]UPW00270.1 phenylacetate-CoA oxygenase subunit PaaC [Halorussus gelatinilyticus]
MASAEQLSGPEALSEDEREAVETLLFRLADDEFVLAERYTEWQVRAPTLESDLALANIAQDELGHARLWYDLLQDFGPDEPDLIWERPPEEWHHSTLTELPFEEGDWADPILRSYLYDVAEELRLEALADSSYARIRDRVGKIRGEEDYHREHAENWLERLCDDEEGRRRVQQVLDRLFPYALTLFAPTDEDVEDRIDELGLRTETLADMREEWLDTVVPYLEGLGLDVDADADLPDEIGRDASHTDDWDDLWDEFTNTYRELGRSEATRIMKDPDEAE